MDTSEEIVPTEYASAARAALTTINSARSASFYITGFIRDDAHEDHDDLEFGLILCDGEHCIRENVRVARVEDDLRVSIVDPDAALVPPHLDPPAGLRDTWIDEQLSRFRFIVLLFYRGRW